MIRRILIWWDRKRSEATIYNALTRDQCVHGFEHTAEELIHWLHGCTLSGAIALDEKIDAFIAEANMMRKAGNRWHNDDTEAHD